VISPEQLEAAAGDDPRGGWVAFSPENRPLGAPYPAAVARIYEGERAAGDEPADRPCASIDAARELAAEWPDAAQKLARPLLARTADFGVP